MTFSSFFASILAIQILFLELYSTHHTACMFYDSPGYWTIPNKFIKDLTISPFLDQENDIRLNITLQIEEQYQNLSGSLRIFSEEEYGRCSRFKKHHFDFGETQFLVPRYDRAVGEEAIKESCKYIIDLDIEEKCILVNDSFTVPAIILHEEKQYKTLEKCFSNVQITNITRINDESLEIHWSIHNTSNLMDINYYLRNVSGNEDSATELSNITNSLSQNFSLINISNLRYNTNYELVARFLFASDCHNVTSFSFLFPSENVSMYQKSNEGNLFQYYALSSSILLLIILMFSLLVAVILKRRNNSLERRFQNFLPNNLTRSGNISLKDMPTEYAKISKVEEEDYKELEISADNVKLGKCLGGGAFGEVYSAQVSGLKGCAEMTITAAVKQLRGSTVDEYDSILEEIKTMHKIGYHRNIVKILGCCTLKKPYMIIMELVKPERDLSNYLRKVRVRWENSRLNSEYQIMNGCSRNEFGKHHELPSEDEVYCAMEYPLDSRELQNFALQIANGMKYLETINIVHRDLAARNILLNEDKVLKISDFGMSKTGAYFSFSPYKQPARWMAVESLKYRFFNTKSDVWSFGVVLWELGTLGALPYKEIDNSLLIFHISRGLRLGKPQMCTTEMYSLMKRCWAENPKFRPTFSELVTELDVEPNKIYILSEIDQIVPSV